MYITGRRKEALDNAAVTHTPENGSIIPAGPCDVKKKEDLERLVKEVGEKEEHINVLITSAGIPGTKAEPSGPDAEKMKEELWEKETVEAWNEVYNADVTSVYFTTIAFLPLLQAAQKVHENFHPSVITISSMSGIVRNSQAHFNYNAAKGATIQLTKMMSAEFLKLGVRVNSVAPGYFPSELTAKDSGSDQKSELSEDYVKSKGHVPIERHGLDEEMAQTIVRPIAVARFKSVLMISSYSLPKTCMSTGKSSLSKVESSMFLGARNEMSEDSASQ